MRVRSFSAGLLLAVLTSPSYGPGTLERLSPATMTAVGPGLKVPWYSYAVAPGLDGVGPRMIVRTQHSVSVVDASTLRWLVTYRLPHAAICDAGFDGSTPVVLVGCGRFSHHYAIVRLDPRRWVTVRSRLPTIGYPATFAYGDGKLFVARGRAYGVDVIDLRTGAVTTHHPRRSLAKGGDWQYAKWLGDHVLALNGIAVDVRTWKKTVLSAHARELVTDGSYVASYGSNGVAVFTRRDLRLYRRFLRGEIVDQACLSGGVLYARVALIWERFDVRTGRPLGRLLLDDAENLFLLC
jgi:hypothetical protein